MNESKENSATLAPKLTPIKVPVLKLHMNYKLHVQSQKQITLCDVYLVLQSMTSSGFTNVIDPPRGWDQPRSLEEVPSLWLHSSIKGGHSNVILSKLILF